MKHSSSGLGFFHSLSLPSSTLARLDLPDPVGPRTTNLGQGYLAELCAGTPGQEEEKVETLPPGETPEMERVSELVLEM